LHYIAVDILGPNVVVLMVAAGAGWLSGRTSVDPFVRLATGGRVEAGGGRHMAVARH
jgi:hypothetical protein